MSGGKGTRLWPVSRKNHAKQYKSIITENTLLEDTLIRTLSSKISTPIIITNKDDLFFIKNSLNKLNKDADLMLEPFGKGTAPAIAIAAHKLKPDDIMLILSSDHFIEDQDLFNKQILKAYEMAKKGFLVTFGINPTSPNTGYGYIKRGTSTELEDCFMVDAFKEKPCKEDAQKYLDDKNYFWNSGIFMFTAGNFLEELNMYSPEIYKRTFDTFTNSTYLDNNLHINKEFFDLCPSNSIDYAVLEKTTKSIMIQCNIGWTDVGTWSSVHDVSSKDDDNNSKSNNILSIDSKNKYVNSNKLTTLLGVQDLVIVDTADALLITNHSNSQNITTVVDALNIANKDEANIGRKVHRPWGTYDSISSGPGFQVKVITVNPGAKLSVQKHFKRSEHWTVVSGIAEVTKNKEIFILKENESTYIEIEEIHALKNAGSEELILIEVQCGSYLGEDDIVRYEDIYGRV